MFWMCPLLTIQPFEESLRIELVFPLACRWRCCRSYWVWLKSEIWHSPICEASILLLSTVFSPVLLEWPLVPGVSFVVELCFGSSYPLCCSVCTDTVYCLKRPWAYSLLSIRSKMAPSMTTKWCSLVWMKPVRTRTTTMSHVCCLLFLLNIFHLLRQVIPKKEICNLYRWLAQMFKPWVKIRFDKFSLENVHFIICICE